MGDVTMTLSIFIYSQCFSVICRTFVQLMAIVSLDAEFLVDQITFDKRKTGAELQPGSPWSFLIKSHILNVQTS